MWLLFTGLSTNLTTQLLLNSTTLVFNWGCSRLLWYSFTIYSHNLICWQNSLRTSAHLDFVTGRHSFKATSPQTVLGISTQASLETSLHDYRRTLVHCCLGTFLHTYLETSLQAWRATSFQTVIGTSTQFSTGISGTSLQLLRITELHSSTYVLWHSLSTTSKHCSLDTYCFLTYFLAVNFPACFETGIQTRSFLPNTASLKQTS